MLLADAVICSLNTKIKHIKQALNTNSNMGDKYQIMQRVAELQSEQPVLDARVEQALRANNVASRELKAKSQALMYKHLHEDKEKNPGPAAADTTYYMLPAAAPHGNKYVLHFGMNNENHNPQFYNPELYDLFIEEAREKYADIQDSLERQEECRQWIVQHMTSCTDTPPELETMTGENTICQLNMNLLGMKMDYLARHNVDFDLVQRVREQMEDMQIKINQFQEFCSKPQNRAFFYENFHGESCESAFGHSYAGRSKQSEDDSRMPEQDKGMLDEIDEIGMLLEDGNPQAGHVLTSGARDHPLNWSKDEFFQKAADEMSDTGDPEPDDGFWAVEEESNITFDLNTDDAVNPSLTNCTYRFTPSETGNPRLPTQKREEAAAMSVP